MYRRPAVEHGYGIAEIETAFLDDPQPLILVPFEHMVM